MKFGKFIHAALLALVLLLSQQIGHAHGISHLSDKNQHSQHNKSVPVEQSCDQCLALAQIGSALNGHICSIQAQVPVPVRHLPVASSVIVSGSTSAFQSRAPPFLA
jgi:hypothetical protein